MLAFLAIGLTLFGAWRTLRANALIPFLPETPKGAEGYTEEEKVLAALSLSYFCYGCERAEGLSGTVGEILQAQDFAIIEENYGLVRGNADDPSTTAFDVKEFILGQIADYRFLCELKDEKSGFYGAAFCDDARETVWAVFAGAVDANDIPACLGAALRPGLTEQERLAFALLQEICVREELTGGGYQLILSGHSLGGELAALLSGVSGSPAVSVNGAVGLALCKLNGIRGEKLYAPQISNYLTEPLKGRPSFRNFVQRLMKLGPDEQADCHYFACNSFSEDAHGVLSFVQFEDLSLSRPILPPEIGEAPYEYPVNP